MCTEQKELEVWPWDPGSEKALLSVQEPPHFSDDTSPAPSARPALYLWPRSYQAANMRCLSLFLKLCTKRLLLDTFSHSFPIQAYHLLQEAFCD